MQANTKIWSCINYKANKKSLIIQSEPQSIYGRNL